MGFKTIAAAIGAQLILASVGSLALADIDLCADAFKGAPTTASASSSIDSWKAMVRPGVGRDLFETLAPGHRATLLNQTRFNHVMGGPFRADRGDLEFRKIASTIAIMLEDIDGFTEEQGKSLIRIARGKIEATYPAWGVQTTQQDLVYGLLHWLQLPEQARRRESTMKTKDIFFNSYLENETERKRFTEHLIANGDLTGLELSDEQIDKIIFAKRDYSNTARFFRTSWHVPSSLDSLLLANPRFYDRLKSHLFNKNPDIALPAAAEVLSFTYFNQYTVQQDPRLMELFQIIKERYPTLKSVISRAPNGGLTRTSIPQVEGYFY